MDADTARSANLASPRPVEHRSIETSSSPAPSPATQLRPVADPGTRLNVNTRRPIAKKRTTGQRCYYAIFILFFVLTVATNFVSLVLFILINLNSETKPRSNQQSSFFDKCILFESDGETNVWSCDLVLVTKVLVTVATILWIVVYIILIIKGTKIFSACRILDMLLFFVLAILSCAAGIIVDIGLTFTCKTQPKASFCPPTSTKDSTYDLTLTSRVLSYVLTGIYFVLFLWKLLMVCGYGVCKKRVSRNEETVSLLSAASPRVSVGT